MQKGRVIRAALLSFAGVCVLPCAFKAGGNSLGFTNSIGSVFLFLGLALCFYRVLGASFSGTRKRWILPGIFGLCFSLCMVMGKSLDEKESVPFDSPGMWAAILILAALFALLVRYVWDRLACFWEKRKEAKGFYTVEVKHSLNRTAVRCAGVIFLLYIPVFLAVYPGFFVYDAQDELIQVMTRSFTTHHPLIHVLFLGGIIQLVHKLTGSYNLGIACYTLIQMAVMAGIFGWCVAKLKGRGMKKGLCLLWTLYFGLFPVLVMFSLCSAKDGLFAGMMLAMAVMLSKLCREPGQFFAQRKNSVLLGVSSLFMMLLRHNGFYAFAAAALCLAIAFAMLASLKRYWKKLFFLLAVVFVLYGVVHGGTAALLSADTSENQEMLTVPISQLARVYQAKGAGEVPSGKEALAQDLEVLCRYLPGEALAHYTPKVTDGVKIHFNNQAYDEDPGSFWRLWAKWGAENPFSYLNAWFMTSYGFWYPDTVIDVYRGNTVFTFTYGDSSYFGYEVEEPGIRESRLPWLSEVYRKLSLEIFQQRVPVVSMLFSPGFLFWVWAFCLGFWCYQACPEKVLPFLPVVFCQLTVLLGPTYLVRYVVYLWTVLPVLLAEFDN